MRPLPLLHSTALSSLLSPNLTQTHFERPFLHPSEFDPLEPLVPNLVKKQQITAQSLAKLERAAYELSIRQREFGDRPGVLAEMVRRSLEDGTGKEGEGEEREGGEDKRGESGRGGKGGRGRGSKRGRTE